MSKKWYQNRLVNGKMVWVEVAASGVGNSAPYAGYVKTASQINPKEWPEGAIIRALDEEENGGVGGGGGSFGTGLKWSGYAGSFEAIKADEYEEGAVVFYTDNSASVGNSANLKITAHVNTLAELDINEFAEGAIVTVGEVGTASPYAALDPVPVPLLNTDNSNAIEADTAIIRSLIQVDKGDVGELSLGDDGEILIDGQGSSNPEPVDPEYINSQKQMVIATIQRITNNKIQSGFDYTVNEESLHFSYGLHDQQLLNSYAVESYILMKEHTEVWNDKVISLMGFSKEKGKLVRVSFSPMEFYNLYEEASSFRNELLNESYSLIESIQEAETEEQISNILKTKEW